MTPGETSAVAKGRNGEIMMRAMRAESFTGYGGLKLVEVPRPRRADGRVLVRITAAGVTPLDHTILSGGYPRATAPLTLGNEGAGVVEDPGDSVFSEGARVMFTGAYGVAEDGTYSEWIAVREEDLCIIPDTIDDVAAGGMPVAYLTAQITLTQAGFGPGKTVLTSLGYSAGRTTTIDVTDLIWKRASMSGFSLFAQSRAIKAAAWATILPLWTSGRVKPVVERAYKLDEAAEALRHLIENRP